MSSDFQSTSLSADPREQLQQCIQENDLDGIVKLVGDNENILHLEYENCKTILEQACEDFAATVNGETIRQLLVLGADPKRSNEIWNHKSAIHFAALGQNPAIVKAYITSLPNEDRNATANGNTALHTIVKEVDTPKESYMDCIRVLVDNGVDIRRGGNTALYWAAKKGQAQVVNYFLSKDCWVTEEEAYELCKLPQVSDFGVIGCETEMPKQALEYLCAKHKTTFLQKLRLRDQTDDDEESFLQYACSKHLMDAVKVLSEINPNKVGMNNKMHPLIIALEMGHHAIVELLLQSPKIIVPPDTFEQSLCFVVRKSSTYANFKRCCELILIHTKPDVNTTATGMYPLQFATMIGSKIMVQEMLQRKASLANRDYYNILTIEDIEHDLLREHFDNCIVEYSYDIISSKNVFLTFDYTTLIPSPPANNRKIKARHNGYCEDGNQQEARQQFTKECEVVLYISQNPELEVLLQHPLIVSFLNAKWHRLRMIFYTNLFMHLSFCLALIMTILNNFDEPDRTFGLSNTALLFTTVFITVREAIQMMIMPRKHIKNFDNYIEIILLIDVYMILFWTTASDPARWQMYAFAILLAAWGLLSLTGSVPELSTYITLLRTVSYNFCKFLAFNGILILAFAFSFYMLFRKLPPDSQWAEGTENKTAEDEDQEKTKLFFANVYISLFKTLVMFTGEFEAGNLDFGQFPVTSHLIFILFVILVSIILLNLLNGLVVSDTHKIKAEAELVALKARVHYISYIESLALDSFCCFPDNSICNVISGLWYANRLSRIIMRRVCIAGVLSDNENRLRVKPDGRILRPSGQLCKYKYGDFVLNENTVKKARMIVAERKADKAQVDQFANIYEILNQLLNRPN